MPRSIILTISLVICQFISNGQLAETKDSVKTSKELHITFDTFRAFQGTLQLNFEKQVTQTSTICAGLMGTWSQSDGIARIYLKAQEFDMKTANGKSIDNIDKTQLKGAGINLKYKSYLGKRPKVMNGLWFGPEIFYRQLSVQGTYYEQNEMLIATKKLFLGYGGYAVGLQKVLFDVICFDTYFGGGFFYSQYSGDKFPTQKRRNYQLDYTGVYLNGSIAIGIAR